MEKTAATAKRAELKEHECYNNRDIRDLAVLAYLFFVVVVAVVAMAVIFYLLRQPYRARSDHCAESFISIVLIVVFYIAFFLMPCAKMCGG